jgi:hypothetical protein
LFQSIEFLFFERSLLTSFSFFRCSIVFFFFLSREQFSSRLQKIFFQKFHINEKTFEAMCAVSQWASLRFKDDGDVLLRRQGTKVGGAKEGTGGGGVIGEGEERVLTSDILKLLESVVEDGEKREKEGKEEETFILQRQHELLAMSGKELEIQLTRREKRQLGRACKECIDVARCCGILLQGYSSCHMFRYTNQSTEDLLLVAL